MEFYSVIHVLEFRGKYTDSLYLSLKYIKKWIGSSIDMIKYVISTVKLSMAESRWGDI